MVEVAVVVMGVCCLNTVSMAAWYREMKFASFSYGRD